MTGGGAESCSGGEGEGIFESSGDRDSGALFEPSELSLFFPVDAEKAGLERRKLAEKDWEAEDSKATTKPGEEESEVMILVGAEHPAAAIVAEADDLGILY